MERSGRPGRKYGFACLVCRRRKIRCGGEKPSCRNCLRASDTCSYKCNDATVANLHSELRTAQDRVQELEGDIRRLAVLSGKDREELLSKLAGPLTGEPHGGAHDTPDSWASGQCEESSPKQAELEPPELSVDASGEIQYFGATSRFHTHVDEQYEESRRPCPGNLVPVTSPEIEYHRKWLLSNSRFVPSWERSAHEVLARSSDITGEVASALMNIYWTWQAPLHNCVYRPTFFRDLVLGGPYFSQLLLYTIYAHACRHVSVDDPRFSGFGQGEYFLAKAKQLLVEEFSQNRPRIPTIQALLILGGRQCAVGKSSEGWLYTGMAIRMVKDLGLHLQKPQSAVLSKLEPDDLEATKRLFFSAYAWDKSISLCLGRTPALAEMPYHPSCLLDNVDNDETWSPSWLADTENVYPTVQSHRTLTFTWFCQLSMIVHEIYNTVYNGKLKDQGVRAILRLEERLRTFYKSLPDVLRVDEIAGRSFCPPPHIFALNILYHTLLILVFRPFFSWSSNSRLHAHALAVRARQVCREEAILVNDFFRAYGKTFAFQNQSYLVSYCVFTAATIELQQIQDPDERVSAAAFERLGTTLCMLETEAKQTPGIRRSVDIIKSRLKAYTDDHSLPTAAPRDIQPHQDAGASVTPAVVSHPPQNVDVQTESSLLQSPESLLIDTFDMQLADANASWNWSTQELAAAFASDQGNWAFDETMRVLE